MHRSNALKYPFKRYYLHELVSVSSPRKLAILSTPIILETSILSLPVYRYFKISLIEFSVKSSKCAT